MGEVKVKVDQRACMLADLPHTIGGVGGEMNRSKGDEQRAKLREKFWPDSDAWTGENEKGWFSAPRTLPLILGLAGSKAVSGKLDPTSVCLELWSRHISEGVIEMKHEGEHAFASGFEGTRAIRSWQERMRVLESNGFIKTKQIGNQRYKYVFLVHPTAVVNGLKQQHKITQLWLDTYSARQFETKERTFEERNNAKNNQVVSMVPKAPVKKKKSA
jgi:hypothetical protein